MTTILEDFKSPSNSSEELMLIVFDILGDVCMFVVVWSTNSEYNRSLVVLAVRANFRR